MMFRHGPAHNWGHAIAYHPALADMLGSVNAAILFQQLSYWSERTENPIGVYKTSEELTAETGLSYREQATARKILTDRGFLIETNKRLEHRIYFRIEWAYFNSAFEDWALANRPALSHSGGALVRNYRNAESAIGGRSKRLSSIDTEITSETTAEIAPVAPKGSTVSDDVKTKKERRKTLQTLSEYLASIPADGYAISPDDLVYERGIPADFINLAWMVFKDRFTTDPNHQDKKYKSWSSAFRQYIDGGFLRLWYSVDGVYQLTTAGQQAQARFAA